MNGFFRDKVITITGGSSGIGRELTKQLVTGGAIVIIGGRNPAPAESVAAELTGKGEEIEFVKLDIQKAGECESFFEAVMQKHGRIDYAFNCAGIIMGGEIRDHTGEDIENVLTTNVLGTSYCAYYAYRLMAKQGFGHIVNFSSGAGLFPIPLMGVYSASKFAVTGLSEALRIEGRSLGVKVSVVTPGLVDTPIYDRAVYSKTDKDTSLSLLRQKWYMIQPDQAAERILRGVSRNKAVIHTQTYVRIPWLIYRLLPWLFRFGAGGMLGPFRRRLRKNK